MIDLDIQDLLGLRVRGFAASADCSAFVSVRNVDDGKVDVAIRLTADEAEILAGQLVAAAKVARGESEVKP